MNLEFHINEVKNIADSLGDKVDEKIIVPVAIFRYIGFPTTGSCEGHLDWGLNYPWIEVNLGKDINAHKIYRQKLERLLSKYSPELRIEDMGIFGAFRLCGLGLYLDIDQQSMIDFTEKVVQ